jgi:hypothetical protein
MEPKGVAKSPAQFPLFSFRSMFKLSARACPEIGLECFYFLFSGLVTVLMCASVFSPVACRDAPNKLDAASTAYEKIYFLQDLLEPMSCHLSTRPRFA